MSRVNSYLLSLSIRLSSAHRKTQYNWCAQLVKRKVLLKVIESIHFIGNFFFTFSSYEKILVLCEKSLSEFSSNLNVLDPLSQKKAVFIKVSVFPMFVETIVLDRHFWRMLLVCLDKKPFCNNQKFHFPAKIY